MERITSSIPCVIWGAARVGSTVLSGALGALNEPFQLKDSFSSQAEIEEVCASRKSIKHLYEECPDVTNIAIAKASARNGYRHIHLVRCNELARLISRDIATQQDAWVPEVAEKRFNELKTGKAKLKPLDIAHLLNLKRARIDRWCALREYLTAYITVRFEDITATDRKRRHHEFRRITTFLKLPTDHLAILDHAMASGGQDTQSVWEFVPNINELQRAIGGTF